MHCIHHDLVCDGHPACDEAEDEELDEECVKKLMKMKIIDDAATYKCKSRMYSSEYNILRFRGDFCAAKRH